MHDKTFIKRSNPYMENQNSYDPSNIRRHPTRSLRYLRRFLKDNTARCIRFEKSFEIV